MNNFEKEIKIRKAVRDDMKQILDLIKELAEFEKMPEKVEMTVETLQNDGFSDHPIFSCLVAETNLNEIVGFALYFTIYSTWTGRSIFLEDLYVQEKFRGKGIGKKIFLEVVKIAKTTNSSRLDFHVLNWNPARAFYDKLEVVNLTEKEEWNLYRLERKQIDKLVDNILL